jgi:hypothetical protein
MKLRSTYIIIAIFLLFIAFISTSCGCCNYVPYSSNSLFKHEYPFEGFTAKEQSTGVEKKTGEKKVEGFEGLLPSPYDENKMLDPFFKTESKIDCEGSGLTKGTGSVCLTPELKVLLQTRGKNATGGESQIGN